MRFTALFLATVLAVADLSSAATTEQLRQWILASRKSIPSDVGADGDITGTILRLLGFGNDRETTAAAIVRERETTTTVPATSATPETTTQNQDVCPFGAEPLLLASDFAYCRLSSVGDCPVGYLCDQSFVLGRSICCRDTRPNQGSLPVRPVGRPTSSVRPPFSWNTVTPTQSPKWVGLPGSTKKAPWYIKDRTNWPTVYNRIGETTTEIVPTTTTTEEPTTTPSTTTTPITTTTSATTTTPKMNPWARLWTSTLPPRNNVNVSVLQAGSIRSLRDGQVEAVGAITLVNDNGYLVLIDTGASSDTERLLQNLAKEQVTLDQITAVVITHGHPGHMGNLNFFAQKPILFHSMEYIGRHVTPTELKERPYRKLSQNIEVWKTPGHTQNDLTVLVHNVAGYGTMAVAGDLIPSEALVADKRDVMSDEGVWDAAIKRQNANLIICMADWIVPGHGQPFRVLPHYRQKAGCTRLLAQRHMLNQA